MEEEFELLEPCFVGPVKEKTFGSLIGKLKQADKNIDSKEAMGLLKEKINGT